MDPGVDPRTVPMPSDNRRKWWVLWFFCIWVAAMILSVIALLVAVGVSGADVDDDDLSAGLLAAAIAGQMGGTVLGCWLVSRFAGTGSMRRDFGFLVSWRDWWLVGAGSLLLMGVSILSLPLVNLVEEDQAVVEDLREATGGELVMLVVVAGILAPLVEELLFRGVLLRGLLTVVSAPFAIGISATIFGAVHLTDGSVGTLVRVPALIAFGAVSGVLAVRSGTLSRSILLHVGFNLPAVVGAILS